MIYVLAGMSCVGKDEAQHYLEANGYSATVSTTSRPIRPNEIHGKNYFYVTKNQFENLIKENALLEYRVYHTTVAGNPDDWYYGVEKDKVNISQKSVVVLDSVGYYAFSEYFGEDNVTLIWIEADDEIRRERNKLRLDYDECEFNRRTKQDRESFGDLRDHAKFIINNNGSHEEFIRQLDNIIA